MMVNSPGATYVIQGSPIIPIMPNGYAANVRSLVQGFDAFGVLVRHYAESIVPGLKNELSKAKDQIGALSAASSNMENENRLLNEHYASLVQRQRREYEDKMQQMKTEFERQLAENSDLIRKSAAEENKALMASKTKEVQRYKAEIANLDKTIRDSSTAMDSVHSMTRSKEFQNVQEKCTALEHEVKTEKEQVAKLRNQFHGLQRENMDLASALEKKTKAEAALMEKISVIETQLRKDQA